MELKQILKTIKLYESTISMILGAVVIAVTAFLLFSYFRNIKLGSVSNVGVQTSNENKVVYVVTKGDTLWKIAEKYYGDGFSWKKIAEANQTVETTIEVGTELTIPDVQTKEETAQDLSGNKFMATAKTNETGTTESAKTQTSAYKVLKGDSLWKIAVKEYGDGYKWVQIAKANKITDPNTIYSGTILKLP